VSTLAEVRLWGTTIGAVSMDAPRAAVFQYDPAFLASAIEVSPLRMPLRAEPYQFPALDPDCWPTRAPTATAAR
jgi:serine/threonine-protein kinase HipA